MTLVSTDLWGKTTDKAEVAMARLREFEPEDGYYLAFSGGKDSIVIYDLAVRSGVKFDAHYNLTTVDPPELVQFIRQQYPTVGFNMPKKTMWQLIAQYGQPPTRNARYCCRVLKEGGGAGRMVILGVRWAESVRRRSNRRMVEFCNRGIKRQFVSPIIDWSDAEVWEYISSRQMPYCHLYDEGFKRIGCVGCPMSDQKRGFDRWPKFRDAYKRAIVRGYDAAVKRGIVGRMYSNGDELFDWWVAQQRNVDHDTLPLQFDQECEEDEDQEMMLE